MLDTCGDAENKLAVELSHHEVQVEKEVLEPLNQLTEVSHCSPRWCLFPLKTDMPEGGLAMRFSLVAFSA